VHSDSSIAILHDLLQIGLVALIDESSIVDSNSMRKAMKNGSGSRSRRHEDQDPNHD
jgi:hypothetical protein